MPVWYRPLSGTAGSRDLEVECLVPRWADVVHHLAQDPTVGSHQTDSHHSSDRTTPLVTATRSTAANACCAKSGSILPSRSPSRTVCRISRNFSRIFDWSSSTTAPRRSSNFSSSFWPLSPALPSVTPATSKVSSWLNEGVPSAGASAPEGGGASTRVGDGAEVGVTGVGVASGSWRTTAGSGVDGSAAGIDGSAAVAATAARCPLAVAVAWTRVAPRAIPSVWLVER